ncbi:MAG: hypothetical protein A2Z95_05935 [Gallionellales bacterium GWA2_60_18]|nr:MAG: hypothetical protein A2Z95_05935 [Gallionellales bacterium GWA2_60_18]
MRQPERTPGQPAETEKYHEDIDIYEFFIDFVRTHMKGLDFPPPHGCRLVPEDCIFCDGCEQLADSMNNIGHASEAMGYPIVKLTLDGIRMGIEGGIYASAPEQRIWIAGKLSLARELIEEMLVLVKAGMETPTGCRGYDLPEIR